MKNLNGFTIYAGILLLLVLGCGSYQPTVVEHPIPFGDTRQELTREYLKQRYGLPGTDAGIHPRMIVLHWTAIPSLAGSFDAFEPERLPGARG
ncbi:MAG: N-acetylmuramoyl-L-alanine amidase, partial [Robiginitalea sp.]|nr:N-acetylmuramoyl-L-alanine amidase [Robiginitalea sp.]